MEWERSPPTPRVYGRDAERARVAEALAATRLGTGAVIVLRGAAGIGKTTLLADAAAVAGDFRQLSLRGREPESKLAFAALIDLLTPLASGIDALSEQQRDAVHAVLNGAEAGNALTIGGALLALVTAAAEDDPLLITIDDAHWIDRSSAEAMIFALLRVTSDPILGIVALRDTPESAFGSAGFPEVELGGLSAADAYELMRRDRPITAAVVAQCVDGVGGNPLALLELDRTLSDGQRRGDVRLDDPLPVGPVLQRLLDRRVDSLPEKTRLALVLAASSAPLPAPLAALLAELDLPPDALDVAEENGILVRGSDLAFAHPLLRAAALHAVDDPARRRVHRVLARAFQVAGDDERAAWHLADAAVGPDVEAAVALERTGARAAARGATASAVEAFERAARLSSSSSDRVRLLHLAANAAWQSGSPEVAATLAREALADAESPMRSEIAYTLGNAIAWSDDMTAGIEVLHEEGERAVSTDLAGAVSLLATASALSSVQGQLRRAVDLGDRAAELGDAVDELTRIAGRVPRGLARLNIGDTRRALEDLAPLDAIVESVSLVDAPQLLEAAQIAGYTQMVREMYDSADATLDRLTSAARRLGESGVLGFASAMRAEVLWRTGRWTRARAEAAVDIAQNERRQTGAAFFGHAVLARVEAGLGLDAAARSAAQAALEQAERIGMELLEVWARVALGFLAITRDDHANAVQQLERVHAVVQRDESEEPGVLWWQGDLGEAYFALGRCDELSRLHAQVDAQADATGRGWGIAIEARLRGLMADGETARDALKESAKEFDQLGAPFEMARSLLIAAERFPDDEGASLAKSRAIDVFTRLGATPWIERALRRGPAVAHASSTLNRLTRSELRVALAVADGLTNREAAETLFLSTRTVEAHLRSIFRKLDVRTRTELSVLVNAAALRAPQR